MGLTKSDCNAYCRDVGSMMGHVGKDCQDKKLIKDYKIITPPSRIQDNRSSLFAACPYRRQEHNYDVIKAQYRESQHNLVKVLQNDMWNRMSNEEISRDQLSSEPRTMSFLRYGDSPAMPRVVSLISTSEGPNCEK